MLQQLLVLAAHLLRNNNQDQSQNQAAHTHTQPHKHTCAMGQWLLH